jgi:enoyl-CoA hydratase/carnithine racemase
MQYFRVERTNDVAVCTMNNPPMNYLTGPMAQELGQLVGELSGDRATRAVIFTGGIEGKFITHYSVEELVHLAADPVRYRREGVQGQMAFHALLNALQRLPVPVIAAINGDCMGGGFEMALACDFRLAALGPYQLGLPESRLGILPGGGGTQRLTRLVGAAKALEVMLFGNVYPPEDALRLGLVHRAVPAHDLMGIALDWARQLAKQPPRAMAMIKRAVYEGGDTDLERGLAIERECFTEVMCSRDAREGMAAYLAMVRRDPTEARTRFLNGTGVPHYTGE